MYIRAAMAASLIMGFGWTSDMYAQDRHDPHLWEIHDPDRPAPPIVVPGAGGTHDDPVPPPSDAVILFDGDHLSEWESVRNGEAPWRRGDGYFEVVPGSGGIRTVRTFGDVQLHVEWASPIEVVGEGQGRGNSGIFLMDLYEVQILDSHDNATYPDGQAGALYGQYPPLVNAMMPPGEWNTFDILFIRPRFGEDGQLASPAYVTILHNGVIVQDHVALTGPTAHYERPEYVAHPDKLPISLQDHGDPVRFRNIWVRELE